MSAHEDLEEDRERFLAALRSLEIEWAAGEIDEVSYGQLRDDYTSRAAAAIRGASRQPAPLAVRSSVPALPAQVPVESPSSERPRRLRVRRRWMLAASILAFFAAAVTGVVGFAAARQPGQEISGSPPVTAPRAKSALTVQMAAELLQARTLVSEGSDVAAAKILTQVLEADPTQPVALAYEGWVLRLAGVSARNPADIAHGRALVAEATALDPGYPDAHAFLGYMYFQDSHDPLAAVTQFERFLADHPLPALVRRTAPVMAQAFASAHRRLPRQVAADLSNRA